MIWVIYIAVCILAILAARQAAIRKNRGSIWTFVTLVFAPAVLLLELLPKRSLEQPVQSAQSGNPPPLPSRGHYAWLLEPVGVVALVGWFAFLAWDASQADLTSGLPRCDSARAFSSVEAAIEGAPLGRVMGISVIKFSNVMTETNTETEMRCKADALLSNSATRPVSYIFTNESGQVFVRFQLQ